MGCKTNNIKPTEEWAHEEKRLQAFLTKHTLPFSPAELRIQLKDMDYTVMKTLNKELEVLSPKDLGIGPVTTIIAYNFDSLKDLIGESRRSIDLALTEGGISIANQRYLNEGMVAHLFNVLTSTLDADTFKENLQGSEEEKQSRYLEYVTNRDTFKMDPADLMSSMTVEEEKVLYTKLNNAYGNANIPGSVYKAIEGDLNAVYNRKLAEWQAAEEGSFAKQVLDDELGNLDMWLDEGGILESLWPVIIQNNIKFLKRLGIALNEEHLKQIDENELDQEQEDNKDTVIGRDTLGIQASNEVNPLTRVKPHLKLLLKTLPNLKTDGTAITNKLGMSKLADFGQTMSILYSSLANTNNNWSKIRVLKKLAEQDNTYTVLLQRLGLESVQEPADLEELSKRQFDLYTSFMTAFNNAKDSYSFLNITEDGNRTIVNSNAESTQNLIKLKWGENFKYNIQKLEGLGEVIGGKTVVNLDYKVGNQTLRELFQSKLTIEQKMDLLDLLGITFKNKIEAQNKIESKENLASISWIFNSLINDRDVSNLMRGDESKNIKNLIQVQIDTDLSSGTLQFTSITGRKKYSITSKGFINVLADDINENFNRIFIDHLGNPKSTTFINSEYLKRIQVGEKIEIGVIDGLRNESRSRGKEISSTTKGNIALLHVSSILQGAVPLIRTGNKKLEKTIRVGMPDYTRGMVRMQRQMVGYLESEIRTAHHIKSKDITDIKDLEKGIDLQYFAHPAFVDLQAEAAILINDTKHLDEEKLANFLNSTTVSASILKYLNDSIQETKSLLEQYGIIKTTGNTVKNIGLDPTTLKNIISTQVEDENVADLLHTSIDKGVLSAEFVNKIAEQITFIREEGVIEQVKVLLGHPVLYGDLFKRTSGLVSPKKYPDDSAITMRLMDNHYPNQKGEHRRTARFITRKEVTEDSIYIEKYVAHLNNIGRPDLVPLIENTYSGMEIFDGGGLIHLDFYRKARVLTESWSEELENLYQKTIKGEDTSNIRVAFSPLKPQVLAAIDHKGIDIRMFNKFALYPVHPNLSKLVLDKEQGHINVLDRTYEDMDKHNLDYTVFESGTKLGAKLNSEGKFEEFVNEEGDYTPIQDPSAIQTYDLRYFGVQQDPKDTKGSKVPAGTQPGSMLPTNIYEDGILAPEYAGTQFSEEESWDQAIDRYHNLTSTLIERDMSRLANRLGFKKTASNDFELIDPMLSKESMKESIIEEMEKRDIALNTKASIIALFDSAGSNHINQLYEKTKIETILNAMITNTVVRREMNGEMVVLQSNLGLQLENKAQTQEEAGLSLDRKLKFYDIDETTGKTTAMQVYLPHYFRKYLGEDFDIKQASQEALQLIGFRIPTEGLNSIDFIEVVGFLPQSAGSNIIVPSEMVAKTGADFDIDKLTLYLPNVEETDGKMDLIKPFSLREDGTLSPKELKRLRELDMDAYVEIVNEMLPPATAKYRLEQVRNNEEVAEFDADLSEYDLSSMGILSLQPKQVLQNELIGFMTGVLEHPSSFAQLITPVGALDLAVKAKKIHNRQYPSDLVEVDGVEGTVKTLAEQISFRNIIETTYNMYQTLGGTGVVASAMTHASKSQRAGLHWNPEKVEFNFAGINPDYASLSKSIDFRGGHINASMQKYISAYVDGEKDPFAMYVNAGKDMAGVHMVLLRSGLPLNTVLSFMSQPIIHEYIDIINNKRSEAATWGDYARHPENELYIKYGNPSSMTQKFTGEHLNSMLDKTFETMSSNEKEIQVQILQDLIRYKEYSVDLMHLQQISSYDTIKLKNGNEVIYLKALEEIVKKKGMFLQSEGLTQEVKGRQSSFLKPLRDTFINSRSLLSQVDFKNHSPQVHQKYVDIAEKLINNGMYKDDVIYYLNNFDNFLSAYIILQEYEGFTNLAQDLEQLVRGPLSLPRQIREESKGLDNLALDNLLPILDEYADDNHDSTVDSLRLIGKKYDIEDINDMVDEMSTLKEEHPTLFENLIKFSLIQSGFSYSPYSYNTILPGQDVLELTGDRYTQFMTKITNHGFNQDYWDKAHRSFISNSWNNPRIIPQKFVRQANHIALLNQDEIADSKIPNFLTNALASGPGYITIKHVKNKDDNTYYYDLYELKGETLVRHPKRGIRNRFIETEGNSIPSNNTLRKRDPFVLGTENIQKVLSGEKTNHLIPRKGKNILVSGEYSLPDGSIVELNIQPITKKKLIGKSKASLNLRDDLSIPHKNSIFAFANSLGFKDVLGFKKSYPSFDKSTFDVASIKVLSKGDINLSEETKGTKEEGSTHALSSKVKSKYTKINKEC